MKYKVLSSLGVYEPALPGQPDTIIDESDLPEGRAPVLLERGVIALAEGEMVTLTSDEFVDLQSQLDAANATIADLQAKGSPKAKDLQSQLDAANATIADLTTKLAQSETNLTETKTLLESADTEIVGLKAQVDAAGALLSTATEEELAELKSRAEAKAKEAPAS